LVGSIIPLLRIECVKLGKLMDRGTMSAAASASVVRSIITAAVTLMTMDKCPHSRFRTTVADNRQAREYKASRKKRPRWHEAEARQSKKVIVYDGILRKVEGGGQRDERERERGGGGKEQQLLAGRCAGRCWPGWPGWWV
jgi:hypothetical protein